MNENDVSVQSPAKRLDTLEEAVKELRVFVGDHDIRERRKTRLPEEVSYMRYRGYDGVGSSLVLGDDHVGHSRGERVPC